MDDSRIIELFFERSEQAISALSQQHGSFLASVARGFLDDEQDVAECMNDAYLGVWNAIPPNRPESLRGFACRVVRNCAIKRFQANRAAKRYSGYGVALEEIEGIFAATGSPEEELSAKETGELINKFLSQLDQQSRTFFVRRYYLGESPAQIAKEFQTTAHYVSVRLNRIREKLRAFLLKEGVAI